MSEHDRSQLGAYALGALEPDEVREMDEHLATCPECRAELAELEEMKEFLGEVPPEAFLDGPPADGDLLLQRTLRQVRTAPEPQKKQRSRWLWIAAALVLIAGALGGGVLIGRQTVDQVAEPPAGSRQVSTTDAVTGTTMDTTVEPRAGWSWIQVHLTGLTAGAECEMLVTDKSGKTWGAGSWVVSEKAARDGSYFGGGVLVPLDQVRSVEIRTVQGKHVVTTAL
ncbi:putative zinc finger protein [Kribbella antiqua]|uniref:Putative zinc finger protein n=1 Tax=Kribbella antiqua TaxID=2512217 RepID=A0A4R2IK94_9ACTN|nr:zf-HC2 domain-containing protein [Kribbella antiqua]TCO44299.1 putative zinc finger protein [Kribbella antiqua]